MRTGLRLAGTALVALMGVSAQAAAARHAVMVIDANSGRVLVAEQADEPRFPASLTKMMTIYLALEQMAAGRLKPETPIRISQEAANQQPSKLDLDAGETIPAIDAIKVLIIKSANDIAVAVAEHIAGNEREFARRMTAKAQQLGMTRTTFRNASGLPDREQVSTARDMLTLALRLHDDFPQHYALFALRSHAFRGKTFANHNTLLRSFEGTEGMKTGYISSSGFNVATSYRRGPKHLFGVVFGGASAGSRNATMRAALTRALPQAATERTRQAARVQPVAEARAKAERPAAVAVPRREAPRAVPVAPAPQPDGAARTAVSTARAAPIVVAEAPAVPPPAAAAPVPVARVRPVLVAPQAKPAVAEPPPAAALPTPPLASALAPAEPATRPRAPQGQPPSTLQAQARAIEAPARVAGPVTVATVGAYQLQIGAYASQSDAERALAETRAKAASALGKAAPVTIAIQKDNRTLYRARFGGFTSEGATQTCNELRRLAVDCYVMKGQ
jgi:D-alanyl-D-alanine carboxypeptidase